MNDVSTKKWYQSKTIWGSIAVMASLIAAAIGFDIPKEEINGIVDQVFNLVPEVLALAGSVLAIYGRLKAERTIQ